MVFNPIIYIYKLLRALPQGSEMRKWSTTGGRGTTVPDKNILLKRVKGMLVPGNTGPDKTNPIRAIWREFLKEHVVDKRLQKTWNPNRHTTETLEAFLGTPTAKVVEILNTNKTASDLWRLWVLPKESDDPANHSPEQYQKFLDYLPALLQGAAEGWGDVVYPDQPICPIKKVIELLKTDDNAWETWHEWLLPGDSVDPGDHTPEDCQAFMNYLKHDNCTDVYELD